MKKSWLCTLLLALCMMSVTAQDVLDLSGTWQLSLSDTPTYNDEILLPGSLLTRGKGNAVNTRTLWTGSLYDSSYFFNPYMEKYRVEGNIKFPFFLTPERHYVGTAWYKTRIRVPKTWKGRQVTLYLERPHIETTVFVNGREVGHQMSLSTPHQYDVTTFVKVGKENEIAVRVYNGIENVCVGQDSHSVTDQTQGNWNGITGRMELRAKPLIYRKRVIPHLAEHSVDVIVNDTTFHIDLGEDAKPWDEFSPHLYTRTVNYRGHAVPITFGLREIAIEGRQMLINNRPLFFRGTVENCCFPLTGYPPTDEAEWLRVLGKCKEYGLNHLRFHSYCPPEAAFAAADKLGLYLQPEGPTWPNHGVKLGTGMAIDRYLLEESKRIVDAYGHHPSFVMMAAGNEPAGNWVAYCNDWVRQMRAYDPTKVYCGASVGGGWQWDDGSEYHVKGGARGLEWSRRAPSSDDDYAEGINFPRNYSGSTPNQTPIIAHEQGQWCAFPDFREIEQYTGAYKARNFEIFRDLLRDGGMEQRAEQFLMASGKLQTLCYKYEMERNLRTDGYAGFQLLALNDYSGQGTALEGVLNVFWREKGYCTAREWTQFCAPVVPLARFPKFVFTQDEEVKIPIDAYNAFREPLKKAKLHYSITPAPSASDECTFDVGEIQYGRTHQIVPPLTLWRKGTSHASLPAKFTLSVTITSDNAPTATNTWDFWIYPSATHTTELPALENRDVVITSSLDSALVALRYGNTVLLTAAGHVTLGSDVRQDYLPIFWNTSWFKMRPPHTTGAYIDREHPLFRHGFPTDSWANLNWWELLNRAQVMNLCELPRGYQSPIQPIDTWHVSRKLGMLIEANVLNGHLLMTTMDITNDLERRPVARQMRRAILDYLQSADFKPSIALDEQVIRDFFERQAPPVNSYTKDSPDELKPEIRQVIAPLKPNK